MIEALMNQTKPKNKKIGICIIATNAYFILGIRFIKKFVNYYNGNLKIKFYFFSDSDPTPYLPNTIDFIFLEQFHANWMEGTNSKFTNIISLKNEDVDYLYYFDADTNINNYFDEKWFLGELVGGQHFGDQTWMKEKKSYDRNPQSKAYISYETKLSQMYYLGAFFGGKKNNVINFCETLRYWQLEDNKIPYEPVVNDESYINKYFHIFKPQTVMFKDFMFVISDKGGIGDTRNPSLDISIIKSELMKFKNILNIDIVNGKLQKKE